MMQSRSRVRVDLREGGGKGLFVMREWGLKLERGGGRLGEGRGRGLNVGGAGGPWSISIGVAGCGLVRDAFLRARGSLSGV